MNSLPLEGKVALVTGGSRGIGAATARKLAALGATVAINYRANADAAHSVVGSVVSAGGVARAYQADVTDPAAIEPLVSRVASDFGRIDILVNNVGVLGLRPLGQLDAAFFAEQFNGNVLSMVLMVQAVVPHFPPEGGKIVNLASRLAYSPVMPGSAFYAGAKAAVVAITQAFARELGPRQITVNAVAPGTTETDMTSAMLVERRKGIEAATPLGRVAQPDDVADAVAFFASHASRWITGRTVIVDGGMT
ncbi:MAG TPA: glucose 1-dehydrogenase [Solimonas sp.]|nr:glucose 1-dehydrogenase [Solimonas sp.]